MRTKRWLIPILLAAAMSIAMAFNAFAAGWVQIGTNWYYENSQGEKVCNEWKTGDDGKWRWLGSNGAMATNTWVDDTYYVDAQGIMAQGWKKISDGVKEYWYYFTTSGKRYEDGIKTIDSCNYYFDDEGRMQTGWIDDSTYYSDADGRIKTGWALLEDPEGLYENAADDSHLAAPINGNKHWYYFSGTGKRFIPEIDNGSFYIEKRIDGMRYCFDMNGGMVTGWANLGDKDDSEAGITDYKYFGSNGVAVTGWQNLAPPEAINGRYDFSLMWFYFSNSGVPYAHTGDNEFYTTADIKRIDGKVYVFDKHGIPVFGLQKIYTSTSQTSYETYYFGTVEQSCVQTGMQSNLVEGDGNKTTFYFTSSGKGYTGVKTGYLFYRGKLQKAEKGLKYCAIKVGDNKYLVNESGQVLKNKKKLKDADGAIWVSNSSGIVVSYEGSTTNIPAESPEEPAFE